MEHSEEIQRYKESIERIKKMAFIYSKCGFTGPIQTRMIETLEEQLNYCKKAIKTLSNG